MILIVDQLSMFYMTRIVGATQVLGISLDYESRFLRLSELTCKRSAKRFKYPVCDYIEGCV